MRIPPPPPPPEPVLRALKRCPADCYPGIVLWVVVGPAPGKPFKAVARCMQCLTLWEVTLKAEVVNVRWGIDVTPGEIEHFNN